MEQTQASELPCLRWTAVNGAEHGEQTLVPAPPAELEQKSEYWQRLATLLSGGRIYEGRVGLCQAWEVRIRNRGERTISGSLVRAYREEHALVVVTRQFTASPEAVGLRGLESEYEYDVDAPPGDKVLGSIEPYFYRAELAAGHRDFVHLGKGKLLHSWYASEEVCKRYEAVGPSGDDF